jgi:hypothetical protein
VECKNFAKQHWYCLKFCIFAQIGKLNKKEIKHLYGRRKNYLLDGWCLKDFYQSEKGA